MGLLQQSPQCIAKKQPTPIRSRLLKFRVLLLGSRFFGSSLFRGGFRSRLGSGFFRSSLLRSGFRSGFRSGLSSGFRSGLSSRLGSGFRSRLLGCGLSGSFLGSSLLRSRFRGGLSSRLGSGLLSGRLLGCGLLGRVRFWLFSHVYSSLNQSGAISAITLESCAIQRMIRPLHITRFLALCELWTGVAVRLFLHWRLLYYMLCNFCMSSTTSW